MKRSDQDPATLRACSDELAYEARKWRGVAESAGNPHNAEKWRAIATRLETFAGIFSERAARNERARAKR